MASAIAGRVAVVGNACVGVAPAICSRLARDGVRLVLADADGTRLKTLADRLSTSENGSVVGVEADLDTGDGRTRLIDEAMSRFSRLDMLIANAPASSTTRGELISTTAMQLDEVSGIGGRNPALQMFKQHVTTRFRLVQKALPHLEQSSHGSVLLMTGIAGFVPFLDLGLYSVVSTATLGLVKALAQSTGKRAVRVNAIAIGMLEGDGANAAWSAPDESTRRDLIQAIPLGRLGSVSDVAGTARFLVSDRARYITGETVVVSGGVCVRL